MTEWRTERSDGTRAGVRAQQVDARAVIGARRLGAVIRRFVARDPGVPGDARAVERTRGVGAVTLKWQGVTCFIVTRGILSYKTYSVTNHTKVKMCRSVENDYNGKYNL